MKRFTWTQFRGQYFMGDWVPRTEALQMAMRIGPDPDHESPFLVSGSRGLALLQIDDVGDCAARWVGLRHAVKGCWK